VSRATKASASVSWDAVLAWRMRRQLLDPIGALDVPETVRRLSGVQAQVPSSAELAIALRRRAPGRGAVDRALADRRLIRTWAMRGTLHLLTPQEAGAYLALIAAGRSWERPAWQRSFGVTPAEIDALAQAATEALDGRVLNREELIEAIVERTGNRNLDQHLRSGWSALLKPLAWMGLVCNGPSRGNRVTFTSPRTWCAGWPGIPDLDAAARTVIPTYLRAYGPARTQTFSAWLTRGSSRAADVRHWFEELADELVTVEVEGESCYALAEDVDELKATGPSRAVRLLAGFDQYLLGPGTSDERIIAKARRRDVSKAAGWIAPVVLDGGRVAGVWTLEGDHLQVSLFRESATTDRAALASEAERVGHYLEREVAVSVTLV
jgi:hypothetical protein